MIKLNKIIILSLFASTLFLGGKSMADDKKDKIQMTLKDGVVVIETRPDVAPKHVDQIKTLIKEGQYDAIMLRFGVDEITHYLGTVGGESLPNYGTLVHGSDNMKQQMLNDFNAWAKSDHGVKCLNKYADDAIMFINRHYECSRPIYICTAVGKDSRHDVMIPYIERVMNAVPCLMWNRDIPDERREICAMIDLWICVASELHHAYPRGSTLSHVASCIKQGRT